MIKVRLCTPTEDTACLTTILLNTRYLLEVKYEV
jgi:hypothetical protein